MAKFRQYKNGIFGHRYKQYYILRNNANKFKRGKLYRVVDKDGNEVIDLAKRVFSISVKVPKNAEKVSDNKAVSSNAKVVQTNAEEEPVAIYKEFNYGDYSTIKLLHKDTNEIEELPLDIYLYGVVSAEMPATFEMEALKAQAIVARTYTIFKIRNGSKHLDVRS